MNIPESTKYDESKLDQEWFSLLSELDRRKPDTLLKPDAETLETQKQRFFADGTNPDLRPRYLDDDLVDELETSYLNLHTRVRKEEQNPYVLWAYRWTINERMAGLRMAKASKNGQMDRFERYSDFVYGKPSVEIAGAIIDWYRSYATKHLNSEKDGVHEAASELLACLPEVEGDQSLLIPDEETFNSVRDMHYIQGGFYETLTAGIDIPETGKITPEDGNPMIQQALGNISLEGVGLEGPIGSAFSVNYPQNEFRFHNYKLDPKRMEGLALGHEIGSHGLEYVNGLSQTLQLMAHGLDRYEKCNEGRAVVREQVAYEEFGGFTKLIRWHVLLKRHLAVSLGTGVVDGDRRDFKGVYDVINKIDTLRNRVIGKKSVEEADHKAADQSWNLLTTVLKGTDGTGGAHRRYYMYLEANALLWQIAKLNPEFIMLGDNGKFDLLNPRHWGVLEALGVDFKD